MKNRVKKILYLTGTRADYELMRSTLLALNKVCDLSLVVTGMHLEKTFGLTVDEIKKDKLKIIAAIKFPVKQKTNANMAENFGYLVFKLSQVVKPRQFDICLVEGDRFEDLAMAIVAKQNEILVLHQGGGDKSGGIDDSIRWAITSFADVHFPGNIESVRRLKNFGINPKNILMFGEPGLDDIVQKSYLQPNTIYRKYGIDPKKKLLLFTMHPDTLSQISSKKQIEPALEAFKKLALQTVIIYPNNDTGGLEMINEIEKMRSLPFVKIYRSLPHSDFLGILNVCDFFLGNSSAGLTEASLLNIPFINIGDRQIGRLCDSNVVSVFSSSKAIENAVKGSLDKKGKFKIKHVYGEGNFTSDFVNFIKSYA